MTARRSSLVASKVRAVVPAAVLTTSARAGASFIFRAWTMMRDAITRAVVHRPRFWKRPRRAGCCDWFMGVSSPGGLGGGVGTEVAVADDVEGSAALVPEEG